MAIESYALIERCNELEQNVNIYQNDDTKVIHQGCICLDESKTSHNKVSNRTKTSYILHCVTCRFSFVFVSENCYFLSRCCQYFMWSTVHYSETKIERLAFYLFSLFSYDTRQSRTTTSLLRSKRRQVLIIFRCCCCS
jgi:hypothetical protein